MSLEKINESNQIPSSLHAKNKSRFRQKQQKKFSVFFLILCHCLLFIYILIFIHNPHSFRQFLCLLNAMKIANKINKIRTDIKQLCNDLGIQPQFKMMEVESNGFNEELLREHELKRNELQLQWKNVIDDFDNLLIDLEQSTASEESECKSPALSAISEKDLSDHGVIRWMEHGKQYRLLSDNERVQVQQRAELKHKQFVEKFQQFKTQRKHELGQGSNEKITQRTKELNKTRKGYAFIYRFSK